MNCKIRLLEPRDLPLLLAWAHIKEIWLYNPTTRSSENLTWEKHLAWWSSRWNRLDYVIEVCNDSYGYRPVGVVHVSELDSELPEIGLYIGEVNLWGTGIGKVGLALVLKDLPRRGVISLKAVIHPDNLRSIRLFSSLGFKNKGKSRKGQLRYEHSVDRPKDSV